MSENKFSPVLIVFFVILTIGFVMVGGYIIGMAISQQRQNEIAESAANQKDSLIGQGMPVTLHAVEKTSHPALEESKNAPLPEEDATKEDYSFQYEEAILAGRPVKMAIKEQIIQYPLDAVPGDGNKHLLPIPETSITTGGGLTENPLAKEKDKQALKQGNPPWLANAISIPFDHAKPMVAIVIDDMGVDAYHTDKVMEIGGALTLAFLPYAPNVRTQASEARDKGYEILIHVPMEPQNLVGNNPGPGALLLKNTQAENLGRLKAYMAQMDGYVGINNHMGSAYTMSKKAMMPIFAELRERGLMFLDSRTTGNSVGDDLADLTGIPFARRDVFLDHDPSLEGVEKSLEKVVAIAKKYGTAVAIGHPKDNTIKVLKTWIPKMKAQGIQVVPLTTITRHRMKSGSVAVSDKTSSVPRSLLPTKRNDHMDTLALLKRDLAPYIASGVVHVDAIGEW